LRADLQPLLGHPVDASGDLKKQAFNIQEALLSVGLFLHIDSTIVEGKSVFFTALYPALNTSARDTASITPERLKNFPHLQIFQADQEVAATPLFEPNLAASIHIDVGSANQRSFIVLNNHYISVSAAESGCTFSSGRQLVLDRELNKTPK
jgi:hypothetical protein